MAAGATWPPSDLCEQCPLEAWRPQFCCDGQGQGPGTAVLAGVVREELAKRGAYSPRRMETSQLRDKGTGVSQGWQAQAAIPKHQNGDWNNRHLFLIALEAKKSKIKVLADSICFLVTALFLVFRRRSVFLLCSHKEGNKQALWCPFLQGHKFHHEDATLMTSSTPNYLPKAPPPNTIALGVM